METDLLAGLERPCCVMTIFPHPDDESFAAGGVMALYFRDPGVRTVSLCLTKGGKSEAMKKAGLPQERETVIREHEYMAATAVLGIGRPMIWDYGDQELANAPAGEVKGRIVEAMKENAADVVITYGPEGITGHVDHLFCSRVVEEASREARVKRLFMVSAPERMARLMIGQRVLPPTHAVDVRRVYPVKMLALKAHASQMLVSRQPMLWVGVVMRMYGKEYFHRAI
ncbi:MAG TPA: PIG-L family deacetylase [bacterium]|nr:PIG-L family deacetylase [bacterium]